MNAEMITEKLTFKKIYMFNNSEIWITNHWLKSNLINTYDKLVLNK